MALVIWLQKKFTGGAGVNIDGSVFFNLGVRFPSLPALFTEVSTCYEWQGKN